MQTSCVLHVFMYVCTYVHTYIHESATGGTVMFSLVVNGGGLEVRTYCGLEIHIN